MPFNFGGEVEKRGSFAVGAFGAALVLLSTLWPSHGSTASGGPFFCLLCGTRGLADAILNLILFIPFGAGVALLKGTVWGLASSALLSSCVEAAQTVIPGRFPTLGDVVFNTLGGGLGVLLVRASRRPLRSRLSESMKVRTLAALLAPVGFLGTAILSTSSGLMTDNEARRQKIGGEVLCTIW